MSETPNISIRRATAADAQRLAPLFDGYRQFYAQPSDVFAAQDFLRQRLSASEAVVLLAEVDDRPCGFTLLYPTFSSVRLGRTWILNDLFVQPAARQAGVGRALLDATVVFGRDSGAIALQLETHRTNSVAQALYIEQGWDLDEEFLTFHLYLNRDNA